MQRKEVEQEAVANGFYAKPSLLFENRNLVAAVRVPEIEKQIVSGVMLDGRAVHRGGQRKAQQRADELGHLAVSQVRRDGKSPITDDRYRARGLPQERDG